MSETSGEGKELRRILRDALSKTAAELDVRIDADPVYGWRDRSIGTAVMRGTERLWVRIVWARPEWARGMWWTGNQDAGVIRITEKPNLVEAREWREGPLMLRAEVMTLVPGSPCAPTAELRRDPDLEAGWWEALEHSLAAISATPTDRLALDPVSVRRRIAVFFDHEVDIDPARWHASHGDLHWNNLHARPLAIVDWEAWGLAPRGYDAAFLLCHALHVPTVAAELTRRFRDELESADGVASQLYVLTKLLTRADGGAHPDLVPLIHLHADRLIGRVRVTRPTTRGVKP